MRLSQRLVEGLTHGKDAMPQYAGTRQKIVGALIHNEGGRPVQIEQTYGTIWTFDEAGEIREGLHEALAEIMNAMEETQSSSATVVSLRPQLNKKRLAEKFRWEPTKADIDRVVGDLWPASKADRLKEAKGTSKRKPPLSYDASHALTKVSQGFWEIAREIDRLKEPSLKGFAFESRSKAKEDPEYRHLYEALAKMADDRVELLKRKRSGKGIWYAVIEVMHQREDYVETVQVIRERCEGRKAAVAAARQLLAKNLHLFDDLVALETRVMTDLEWEVMSFPN
ncbi:hypothetical protein ASD31_15945 [Rhizobium sp. Root482]|nr:hypothetical protein ASD31_15945 [Rhizobium sp. Root482]